MNIYKYMQYEYNIEACGKVEMMYSMGTYYLYVVVKS